MIPFKRIVWLVLDQNFKNTEEKEWKGTTVLFEISGTNRQTRLQFTHQGLVPPLNVIGFVQMHGINIYKLAFLISSEKEKASLINGKIEITKCQS